MKDYNDRNSKKNFAKKDNKKSVYNKSNKSENPKRKNLKSNDKLEYIRKKTLKTNEKNDDFEAEDELLQIEGRNGVLEALKNDKEIDKIFIKKNEEGLVEGSLRVIKKIAMEKSVVVIEVNKDKLDKMAQTNNHQGVIAVCPAISYVELNYILEVAKNKNEDPFVLIVDSITDPHNLGAIIRSCETAGVHGVIIPKRRNVGISAIVSKTSAGAIEHVPICKVTNLTTAIEELKKAGLWIGCGDMNGELMYKSNLKGPIGLVIGSEGYGVSRLVKENCDFIVSIPMLGKIESLNASVAAGVLLYEIVRQRSFS